MRTCGKFLLRSDPLYSYSTCVANSAGYMHWHDHMDVAVWFAGGFDDAWGFGVGDLQEHFGSVDGFQGVAQVAAVEGYLRVVAVDYRVQVAFVVAHFGACAFDHYLT